MYANNLINDTDKDGIPGTDEFGADAEKKQKRRSPVVYVVKELGNDSTKCPGEGFKWRGNEGPETGKGSWVKDHEKMQQE